VNYRWDDVAVFLALLRERTTGRAAACLGCSQPTVVRRIAALEAASGLTLFDRSAAGFIPTEAAMQLAAVAERMERAAQDLDGEISDLRGDTAQVVRLTLLDHFERLFVPILCAYRDHWPDVRVDMFASDRIYDLARGEADIAVRGRLNAEDDALVSRRLPDCAWTLYAPADMPDDRRPAGWHDLDSHIVALPDQILSRLPIFLRLAEATARSGRTMRCNNYNSLRSTVITARAITALPLTVGDHDPLLVRCFAPPPEFDVPIYLIGRRASLRRPFVRDLFERIDAYFAEHPEFLTGHRRTGPSASSTAGPAAATQRASVDTSSPDCSA